jgi:hypothetical protein
MNAPRQNSAKILNHAQGLGVPTAEEVRKRARELAQIDGYTEPNESHWQQAKRELHGGHDFENGSHEHDMQLLVSEHDFVSADPGRHTPKVGFDDDHILEELVAEGMDEALHEQMLEARKSGLKEDEIEEELTED